jgi:excisionase family DNA binding protein
MTTFPDSNSDVSAQIVALFTILIHAWQSSDFREAASARDKLEQNGVKVQIRRRRLTCEGGQYANSASQELTLLLKPVAAAKSLEISPRTLWGLTANGEIPHVKIGRCVRYAVDDLQKWIAAQKKGGDVQ